MSQKTVINVSSKEKEQRGLTHVFIESFKLKVSVSLYMYLDGTGREVDNSPTRKEGLVKC